MTPSKYAHPTFANKTETAYYIVDVLAFLRLRNGKIRNAACCCKTNVPLKVGSDLEKLVHNLPYEY